MRPRSAVRRDGSSKSRTCHSYLVILILGSSGSVYELKLFIFLPVFFVSLCSRLMKLINRVTDVLFPHCRRHVCPYVGEEYPPLGVSLSARREGFVFTLHRADLRRTLRSLVREQPCELTPGSG